MSLIHALIQSFIGTHQHNTGYGHSSGMSLIQSLIHRYKAKTVIHSPSHSYIHQYIPAALK